jgi:hypothetical protein
VRAMLLIPLLLTSCAVVSEDGAVMLGGKGAAKGGGKTGGGWAMVWNGEKSFSDAALLIGAVATSGFAAASHKATEATSQVVARETTKRAAAVETTKRTAIATHGAAYGTAVAAEVPGVVAPAAPVAPIITQ